MRVLMALIVAVGLSGCAGMLLGNTGSGGAGRTTSEGTTSSPQDNAITAEIRTKYRQDAELGRFSIEVSTRAGVVRLAGTVGSYAARDRAAAIARATGGVRSVDSRLVVNTNL